MFPDKEQPKYRRMLEDELEHILAMLSVNRTDSQEYAKLLARAERIYEMMNVKKKSPFVSRETLVTVGANLLGILMIIRHEDVNVITSKALGFVIRVR